MVDTRSKERRQGEIEEHEDGPDGTEEQEGEGGRRVGPPAIGEVNHVSCEA